MQPGTGPSSVTSTTKYRQRTRRRYPPADKPSWNSGHSSTRSGDAGQGVQKSGWGRLLRPLVMTQVWLSSPHRSRHSCDGERHLVARFLRADQVQARTDVRRTVRDRAATIHSRTIAVVQHLVRRRIKHHEPSVLFHLSSIASGTEGGQGQTSSIWGTFGRFVWASTSALAGLPSSSIGPHQEAAVRIERPSDGACHTSLAGAMLVERRHRCRDDRRSLAAERAVAVRVLQDNRRGESE